MYNMPVSEETCNMNHIFPLTLTNVNVYLWKFYWSTVVIKTYLTLTFKKEETPECENCMLSVPVLERVSTHSS
jgi:hypothetical protein